MKRDTDELVQEQAERELVATNRVAWTEAVRQDPEYRSMADAPLPDAWYVEAERVAKALGQRAATDMLQAEHTRRNLARIDARLARDKARRGVTWVERLGAGLWTLVACGVGAACVCGLVALGAGPHMATQVAYVLTAMVAVASVSAAGHA